MANFDVAYFLTNAVEGDSLSNHYADRGGETFAGIARNRNPAWTGWDIIDLAKERHSDRLSPTEGEETLLKQLHRQFFHDNFWTPIRGGDITWQPFANELYDSAVLHGPDSATRWMQTALNVSNRRQKLWPDIRVDGRMGPATLHSMDMARKTPERAWLVLQVAETQQENRFFSLALADEVQEENLYGWYRKRIQNRIPPPS